MKIFDLLTEKEVDSSWIKDVTYTRTTKIATITLNNGWQYQIHNISRRKFDKFHAAPSKGAFYNYYIRNDHNINRIH